MLCPALSFVYTGVSNPVFLFSVSVEPKACRKIIPDAPGSGKKKPSG
jgi:hypothetical protein